MLETGIAWTDSTFNGWIGCTKVGPGCDACYAHAMDAQRRFEGKTHWGPGVPRYRTSAHNWHQPEIWNRKAAAARKRWLVFCSSLADVFDNEVPPAWRADLFALIRRTPHLTWQLVTKRIGNAVKMLPADWGKGYRNVWLISTIVNQDEADRDLAKLLEVPAQVHGVSYEPALGPVDWMPYLCPLALVENPFPSRLDWIIIGGESTQSGHKPRAFQLEWATRTIEQCHAAGAYPFMKQVGSNPMPKLRSQRDRAGAEPEEWPEALRVREFPPHA